MFVNGCMSAGSISAKANSISVDGASGIGFLASTGYTYVTAGAGVNLTLLEDNGGMPLASRAENIVAAGHYTVFAGGAAGAPAYVFTTDDLTPPTSGNAKLRFVNLSPDYINEVATANDTIISQAITTNTASDFYQLKAGAYAIGAFVPGNKYVVINADSMAILAGKIYTIVLTGSATGAGTDGLLLSVIKNN